MPRLLAILVLVTAAGLVNAQFHGPSFFPELKPPLGSWVDSGPGYFLPKSPSELEAAAEKPKYEMPARRSSYAAPSFIYGPGGQILFAAANGNTTFIYGPSFYTPTVSRTYGDRAVFGYGYGYGARSFYFTGPPPTGPLAILYGW